jgi:hypothetical protein
MLMYRKKTMFSGYITTKVKQRFCQAKSLSKTATQEELVLVAFLAIRITAIGETMDKCGHAMTGSMLYYEAKTGKLDGLNASGIGLVKSAAKSGAKRKTV